MRIAMTVLAAGLMLTACATRPQVAHDGDVSPLKGQVILSQSLYQNGLAKPGGSDVSLAKAIEGGVEERLIKRGSVGAGLLAPRYLIQVSVGTSASAVGISTAAGTEAGTTPWRSAPTKLHFWNSRGPNRTATLVVIEVATGKVTAWATVRSSSTNAADFSDRLVAAIGG